MLGGLALKRRWQKRRAAEGKPADKPNLVMGINVQVCWEKFANYWDVEMRLVPMEGDRFHLSAEEAVKLCDENTIGVVAILGSTFDGSYEPVKEICDALDAFQARDRASTFPCTSTARPGRSSRRSSTPTSCGTSGCRASPRSTPPGTSTGSSTRASAGSSGATRASLPEDLIFWVNYLGDNMPTFALNFSRPGRAGRRAVLQLPSPRLRRLPARAGLRARRRHAPRPAQIAELGPFELITKGDELPVFAFTLQGRRRQLHRLRRLERAARARLAGAGVHVPEEP